MEKVMKGFLHPPQPVYTTDIVKSEHSHKTTSGENYPMLNKVWRKMWENNFFCFYCVDVKVNDPRGNGHVNNFVF